ncbi:MAG TPA: hypothetical protein VKZ63_20495 [Kofleriaceae bacterium]|nr:hypothetical protein [Kofleriaceae bacterium]
MGRIHRNGGESGSMRGTFGRGLRGATERMRGAGEHMGESVEGMREHVSEMGGRFGGMVREHPMMAIVAGVGLGFLVGRLLSRE